MVFVRLVDWFNTLNVWPSFFFIRTQNLTKIRRRKEYWEIKNVYKGPSINYVTR